MREAPDAGVTLIELLVVVALIAILAAFAFPRLMHARQAANETSAIGSLHAVALAEDLFAKACGHGAYAVSTTVLGMAMPDGGAPFLPADLSSSDLPVKDGYLVTLAAGRGASDGDTDCHGRPTYTRYYATATPTAPGVTGRRSFAVTTPALIWEAPGGAAPGEPLGAPARPIQ
jgi:prepilin-type N-terminal cleavage/methylation domain-containing protein